MGYLNYEFFDEFKALDNICRDIYGESVDKKLGVTLYLEDMESKTYIGAFNVSGWRSDYNQLKNARTIRNELAHSRNSFSVDICSQDDIDFVRSFKARILNQTDPIALLRKQTNQPHSASASKPKQQSKINSDSKRRSRSPAGCFGAAAAFILAVICVIVFLS